MQVYSLSPALPCADTKGLKEVLSREYVSKNKASVLTLIKLEVQISLRWVQSLSAPIAHVQQQRVTRHQSHFD